MRMTYYDTIAPSYDELHGDEQLEKMDVCRRYIEPSTEDKLLDIGCGTGISTEPWECRSFGIDPAKELIRIAKEKRRRSHYRVAPAEEIPFGDGDFDYVISITAIQNFSDMDKALREMVRVLKDDGKMIVSTLKDSPRIKDIEKTIENHMSIEEIYEGRIDRFFICRKR